MRYLIIAWRNLWRNKKRTVITVGAVVLAVFLSTAMSSMQEGTYSRMIDNVVKIYSGYLQVHHPRYWESKSINDIYVPEPELLDSLMQIEGMSTVTPRLESFALLSSGNNTKGAAIIGVDARKEDAMTNLSRWVVKGEYLRPGDDGILLAYNLAKQMGVDIGDTLILLSQGYHAATAAGLHPVRGILKFASPDMNNLGAYMDIEAAQHFFSAHGMVTSLAFMIDEYDEVGRVKTDMQQILRERLNVMTWDEMQPEIVQMIEGDRAGGVIVKAILYIIVGFGIFGTIIMMVAERRRENGIMVAVGMHKAWLALVLFFETVMIGILGLIAGFLISLPGVLYFVRNPIPLGGDMAEAYEKFGFEAVLYFSMDSKVFGNQLLVVFIITLVISLYPVLKIAYLNVINALRA